MDCDKVKELIPSYFNHRASEEEVKMVEEHLCICHNCRTLLGELMDKEPPPTKSEPHIEGGSPNGSEEPSSKKTPEKDLGGMEYFPAKEFEDILNKPPESAEDYPIDEEGASSSESGSETQTPKVDDSLSSDSESQSSGIEYINDINQDGPIQSSGNDISDPVSSLDDEATLSEIKEIKEIKEDKEDKEDKDDIPSKESSPEVPLSDVKEDKKDDALKESPIISDSESGKKKVVSTPLGPISLDDELDEQPKQQDSGESEIDPNKNIDEEKSESGGKVIQTPLGPMTVSSETGKSDDKDKEDAIDTPQISADDSGEKTTQTPFGPISVPSEDKTDKVAKESLEEDSRPIIDESKKESESVGLDNVLDKSAEESSEEAHTLPVNKSKQEPEPAREEEKSISANDTEPLAVETEPIKEEAPVYSGEHADMSKDVRNVRAPGSSQSDSPNFELDHMPIASDKMGAFGYHVVVIAVLALVFVAYLFL